MADTTTPFLQLTKPEVNGAQTENVWGYDINANFDKLDAYAAGSIDVDAPSDGYIYGRQNGNWSAVASEIHTHPVTDVVGFVEAVDDRVAGPAGLLRAGTNIQINYDDTLGIAIINSVLGSGSNVADGDWGDIQVSGGGTSMQIDPTVMTPAARTVLDDATVAAMRTTLGAAATVHTHPWADITGAPTVFPPSAHTHPISDVTNLQGTLDAKAPTSHTHTTAQISGLDTALAGKLATAGGTMTGVLNFNANTNIRMQGLVTAATDLSQHLSLYGMQYGMSVRNDGMLSIVSQGQAAIQAASTGVYMPGTVTTGPMNVDSLQSRGVSLVLGAVGDAVYLRPHGAGNGTGQAYQRADGYFVTGGVQTGPLSCTDISASSLTTSGAVQVNGSSISVKSGANSHVWFQDGNGTNRALIYFEPASDTFKMQHQNAVANQPLMIVGSGQVRCGRGILSRDGYSGGNGTVCYNLRWDSGSFYLKADDIGIGTIAVTSDYRTKKDVVDLPGTWDIVKALRPIKYTQADFGPTPAAREEDGKEATQPLFVADDIERWGFIAHELQETMTMSAASAYKDAPDDIQAPNPWTIIAALTKTVQELQARVEALEAAP